MPKIPCEECLILPICVAKKTIKCKLLLKTLKNFTNEQYSNTSWSDMSLLLKKTLRGDWHIMVTTINGNTQISSIKKYNLRDNIFVEEKTHELFHIV